MRDLTPGVGAANASPFPGREGGNLENGMWWVAKLPTTSRFQGFKVIKFDYFTVIVYNRRVRISGKNHLKGGMFYA